MDPQRVELGYDYCTKPACQERCVDHIRLAGLGVNKAADYYVRADEVLPPPRPDRAAAARRISSLDGDDEGDEDGLPPVRRPSRTPGVATKRRTETTLERLRRLEGELDAALAQSYERFLAGRLTARELDRDRDRLVRAFNRQVLAANIRYRSLLRRP